MVSYLKMNVIKIFFFITAVLSLVNVLWAQIDITVSATPASTILKQTPEPNKTAMSVVAPTSPVTVKKKMPKLQGAIFPDENGNIVADLKGDGAKEKIQLVELGDFTNLVIYSSSGSKLYESKVEPTAMSVQIYEVVKLRNDHKSQLVIKACNPSARIGFVEVVEWIDGSFVRTYFDNSYEPIEFKDLNGDGNKEIIQHSDYHAADVFEFSLKSNKFLKANSKYKKFIKKHPKGK